MTAEGERPDGERSAGSHGESPIAVYGAITANFLIAIAKFGGALLTGSSSMISEGIHSLVDTGNQGLLLVGIHRSRAAPDDDHPFGHGKELYFWSLVVAIGLFGIGGGMSIYEGFTHLQHPSELQDPFANYVILGIALIFEGASWMIAFRQFLPTVDRESVWHAIRTSKDPSTITVLVEDSAALTGLVVAAGGIALSSRFGDPRFDAGASIVIGIVLASVGLFLAYESRGLLIGERADARLVDEIETIVEDDPAIRRAERPKTMHLGPNEILTAIRVEPEAGTPDDVIDAVDRVAARLDDLDPRLRHIYVMPTRVLGAGEDDRKAE